MKTKDCYVCVFYMSVLKLFILLLFLPFSFTAPAGQPFDQFMGYVRQHQCHLPEQIKSFSESTSNWDSLSKSLKPCKREDNEFEGHLLCAEIFENLINTTCHLPNVLIPPATFKLSSDVCNEFGAQHFPIPQIVGYVGAKLANDVLFCKIACKDEYEKLCQILFWSYEVRFFIENAVTHPQALDGQHSVNSPKENFNAAQTKMITAKKTIPEDGNIKSDAKDNKIIKVVETPEVDDNQLGKKQESKLKKLDNKKLLENEHTTEDSKSSSVLQNENKMPQNLVKQKGNTLNEVKENQKEYTNEKQDSQDQNTHDKKQENQNENATNENLTKQDESTPNKKQENQNVSFFNENQVSQNKSILNKNENQNESIKAGKNEKSTKQEDKLTETSNDAKTTENNTKDRSFLPKIAVNLDSQINASQINDERSLTEGVNKNLVEKGKEPNLLPETGEKVEQVQPNIVKNDVSKTPAKVTNNQDASGSIVNSVSNLRTTSVKSVSTVQPLPQNDINEIKKNSPSTVEITEASSNTSSISENYSSQNTQSSTLKPDLEKMDDANEVPPPVQEHDQYDDENVGEYDRPDYAQDTGLSSPTVQQKVIAQDLFITSEKTDVGSLRDVPNDMSFYDDIMPRTFDGQVSRDMHDIPSFPEEEDGHFFFYFLTIIFILMAGYLIFHNKQKIIALIVEGRHERRRRSYSAGYKKLETK